MGNALGAVGTEDVQGFFRACANRRVACVPRNDTKAVHSLPEQPSAESSQPIGAASYSLRLPCTGATTMKDAVRCPLGIYNKVYCKKPLPQSKVCIIEDRASSNRGARLRTQSACLRNTAVDSPAGYLPAEVYSQILVEPPIIGPEVLVEPLLGGGAHLRVLALVGDGHGRLGLPAR